MESAGDLNRLLADPPPEPDFEVPGWYPTLPQGVNILSTVGARDEQMAMTVGQFNASTEVERLYDTQRYDVYYSNSLDFTPPVISATQSCYTDGTLSVTATITDTEGVLRGVLTYTDGAGAWQSINLTQGQDNGWEIALVAPEDVQYLLQAVDNNGNTSWVGKQDVASCITQAAVGFGSGWNLMALPIDVLTPYTAQAVLDEINAQGGACSEVDRWLNGGWDAHINNLPFNDFAVEPGKGYFLKCTANSQWTFDGHALTTGVPLTLQSGWNLVGMPYPAAGYTAQSLLDAIASQGGECSEVDRWLNGGWDAHINNLPFNDFVIEPDKGYFLKCSLSSVFVAGDALP